MTQPRRILWFSLFLVTLIVPNTANLQAASNSPSWSSPSALGQGALNNVSCPSAAFCLAVDFHGNAYVYDGFTWTGTNIDGQTSLEAVSCSSPTFCVAGDKLGGALFFDGLTWSAPQQVAPC